MGFLAPIYHCGTGKEGNKHQSFLHCPQLGSMRINLPGKVSEVPALGINYMNTTALYNLLLNGSSQLNISTNTMILKIKISYTGPTQCFK